MQQVLGAGTKALVKVLRLYGSPKLKQWQVRRSTNELCSCGLLIVR